jgi:hypothetical protein
MANTNGSSLLGVEGNTAGTLCTGTLAYSSVLRNYTATDLHIGTNNIVRATFTSAGNLGIGTSSPVQIAHLQASGTSYLHIGNNSTGASASDGCDIGYFSGETLLNIVQRENDAIALSTSGSERMRITSAGQVTIPNQPAWSVGLSAQQNFSSTPGTILWNQSSGNECFVQGGVSLNGGNGRITVPVAGKYVVFASIRTEATGAAVGTNLNLRKNGATLQRHYVGGAVNSAGSFMYIETRPIIVNCAANDYIDLHFDSVTNDFVLSAVSNTVVRFGGYLVG